MLPRAADRWDVFVSHNGKQKPWVRLAVSQWREKLGLMVFFDEDSIEPGEEILRGIERGLQGSRRVVLVLTQSAVDSRWVALETALTLHDDPAADGRRLIPVLLEPVEAEKLRPALVRLRWVDLTNEELRRDDYHRLLKCLKEGLPTPLPDPPPWNGAGAPGPVAPPAPTAPVPVPQPPRLPTAGARIDLVLDRPIDEYTDEERYRLLEAIRSLLRVSEAVQVIGRRQGSMVLTVELPPGQTDRLYWAVQAGELAKFGVRRGRLLFASTDRRPVAPAAERVPLVIGWICQQGLAAVDREPLKARLVGCLAQFQRAFPDTPLLLLTAQAPDEEAIARAAVSWPGIDGRLIVVLSERAPASDGTDEERALGLWLARAEVVRNCQFLVAYWEDQGLAPFETAPLFVSLKRTGRLPEGAGSAVGLLGRLLAALGEPPADGGSPSDPLEAPETGPVYRLRIPPDGAPLAEEPTWERLAPEAYEEALPEELRAEEQGKYFRRLEEIIKDRLNRLNADARAFSGEQRKYFRWLGEIIRGRLSRLGAVAALIMPPDSYWDFYWNDSREQLLPEKQAEDLPEPLHALRDAFATADTLALRYQRRARVTVHQCLFLVFLAVLAFGVHAHLLQTEWNHWALAAYLGLLAVADAVYLLRIRKPDTQNLHQDYRTLAEGLRGQFYLRLAGLPDAVSDYYLSKQKNELEWIRDAVTAGAVRSGPLAGAGRERLEDVLEYWIKGQVGFFVRASLRDRAGAVFYRELAAGFLAASLAASLFAVVFAFLSDRQPWVAAVFAGLVVPVGTWHLILKYRESKKEFEQDSEEMRQAQDDLPAAVPELKPPAARRDMRHVARKGLLWGLGGGVLLIAALAGAAKGLTRLLEDHAPEGILRLDWHDWLIVGLGVTVAAATLIQWSADKRAFAEHHKQYRRMRTVFARAYSRVRQQVDAGDLAAARQTLAALGREALAEHADWLLLHRDRPVELPRLEI
jgi:hypothetical protein